MLAELSAKATAAAGLGAKTLAALGTATPSAELVAERQGTKRRMQEPAVAKAWRGPLAETPVPRQLNRGVATAK
jgi:hypothetical protein